MKHFFYISFFLAFLAIAKQSCAQTIGPVLQLDGSVLFQVDHIIINAEGKIAYLDLIEDIPITVSLENDPIILLEEQYSYLKLQEKLPKSLSTNFKLNANDKIAYFNGYAIDYNFKNRIDNIGTNSIEYNFKNKIEKIGSYEISYNFKGKIDQVGTIKIEYNFRNQIDKIGNKDISYNLHNQIDQIGDTHIDYDLYDRVEKIGKIHIDYNLSNRIDHIGDLDIEYDARGEIYKIGHQKFIDNIYSPALNNNLGF